MRLWASFCATVALTIWAIASTQTAPQVPFVQAVGEKALGEYAGVYQWGENAFVYLQLWSEFTGTNQLVAFDESGEVRTLYPTERDRFFTGPGAAVQSSVESHVEFQRDVAGKIISMQWRRENAPARIARRVEIEQQEEVRFANGSVQLA